MCSQKLNTMWGFKTNRPRAASKTGRSVLTHSYVDSSASVGPVSHAKMLPVIDTTRHTKATPAVWKASQAKSTFGCPLLLLFGFGWNVCGGIEWRRRQNRRRVPAFCGLSHLCLFGEFADDADQCSILIFQPLVVCSQVTQNLVVKSHIHYMLGWTLLTKSQG